MKNILQLNAKEAKDYFLSAKRYCTLDLPEYYSFDGVLKEARAYVGRRSFYQLLKSCKKDAGPDMFDDVNYVLVSNKKSKYKWRQIELIHPVFYIGIVNEITKKDNWELICKRFQDFRADEKIKCCSIPLVDSRKSSTVLNWWNSFEQQSISYAIDYTYMGTTDIENCYPSIYTHSIAWAIHTKPIAKEKKTDKSLLGNNLDKYIRGMQFGQTNGIPQGSVLMDFIAEIVLGYADELLSEKLKENGVGDYQILRYRDDYRIFTNEKSVAEEIIKYLAIVLSSLNLNISAEKTHVSNEIVLDSIKPDKRFSISHSIIIDQTLEKQLMCIYDFSLQFPNSGSLKRELNLLYKAYFCEMNERPNSYEQLISIILEIMNKNQTTYPLCIGILSEIFKFLKPEVVSSYVNRIINKFQKEPFSDYLEVWLQRITLYHDKEFEYKCRLCQKVYSQTYIWNSSWMDPPLDESSVIDCDVVERIKPNLSKTEVDTFSDEYDD